MIDNFDKIMPLLSFDSDDEFYFVQILQRKKDHDGIKGSNNSCRCIKTYRIDSVEKLKSLKSEMVELAIVFNARIGINLNKRSYYKTAFNMLKKIADQMSNKNFKGVRSAYDSVCGIHDSSVDKLWIIDIDECENRTLDRNEFEIIKALQHSRPLATRKILKSIPSKHGCHFITKPFNKADFYKYLAIK